MWCRSVVVALSLLRHLLSFCCNHKYTTEQYLDLISMTAFELEHELELELEFNLNLDLFIVHLLTFASGTTKRTAKRTKKEIH